MKYTVCIPMYNEILSARSCAEALTSKMESFCSENNEYEIILSDDGSIDGTFDSIPEFMGLMRGSVKKIRSEKNMGKGAAVRNAVMASEGDIVLYTDCDLAYGCDIIPEAIDKICEKDLDILIGSRAIHPDGYSGYSWLRKAASKSYVKILTSFAGFRLSDSQCGFKVFKGNTARSLFSVAQCNGWAFDFEILMMASKKGLTIGEIPVTIVNHRESRINMVSDSINMLREILKIKKRLK